MTATRTKRTELERAQEALKTAENLVTRVTKKLTAARVAVAELEAEAKRLTDRLEYVSQNPALPEDVRARYRQEPELPDPEELHQGPGGVGPHPGE